MPIYEYMMKCDCKKVVSSVTSVENRNKDIEQDCNECEKKVKAKRIFSKPLIKVTYGFSDFKDSDVLEETEI